MSQFNIVRQEIQSPIPLLSPKFGYYVGIDAGTTNLGVAFISPYTPNPCLYQIKIERSKDPIERIKLIPEIWNNLQQVLSYYLFVIIEGAAYMASPYRQAELAEIRTAFAIELMKFPGSTVKIENPKTIRKVILDSGLSKASVIWRTKETEKMPDALDALCCAYYGMVLNGELVIQHKTEKEWKQLELLP